MKDNGNDERASAPLPSYFLINESTGCQGYAAFHPDWGICAYSVRTTKEEVKIFFRSLMEGEDISGWKVMEVLLRPASEQVEDI